MNSKIAGLLISALIFSSSAEAANPGFRYINTRGTVRCGTDLSTQTYAYKDEGGYWRGIDADLCRVFAAAILGNANLFELVNVPADDASKALGTNKIDIMLGNAQSTAAKDAVTRATPAALLYYSRQMFLAHKIDGASSMEDYQGKRICAAADTEDLHNLQEYSEKYNLDLKFLQFNDIQRAKEAFLLKRCDLLSGNEIYLRGIEKQLNNGVTTNIEILPEVIAYKPIYAQTDRENHSLRTAVKWIINALPLAERYGINSKNTDVFIGIKNTSVKNLLGADPVLWEKFKLRPDWVKKAVGELGNYGEIFERNLGEGSEFKIPRDKNELFENGGVIKSRPFL